MRTTASLLLAAYDFAIVGLDLAVALLCLGWPRGELWPMTERWTGASMLSAAVTAAGAGLVTLGVAPLVTIRVWLFGSAVSFTLGTCGNISSDDPRATRLRVAILAVAIPLAFGAVWATPLALDPHPTAWSPGVSFVPWWRAAPFVVLLFTLMCAEALAILRYWPRDQARAALGAGLVVLALGVVDFAALAGVHMPLAGSVTAAAIVGLYIGTRIVAQYRVALAGLEGRVPGYALKRFLGAGGMAEVFMAESVGLVGPARRAAVKRVRRDLVDDPALCAMFVDEARLAARLEHPNIVKVFSVGTGSGRPYIAMELIEGLPLSAVLRRRAPTDPPIPLATIAAIGAALCDALAYAHRLADADGVPLHLVHRDVSPQNVMIDRDGGVKLIDFGVARARTRQMHTEVGHVRGKLSYAAPEQLRGDPLDGRADLFALGVVLYELATLQRPFGGTSESAICAAILEGRRRPILELRPDATALAAVIDRALAPDRDERFADATEFAAALRAAFGDVLAGAAAIRAMLDTAGGPAKETARSTSVDSTTSDAAWEDRPETELDRTRRVRPTSGSAE